MAARITDRATLDDLVVAGRRVLVRVDFNVPMRAGVIADDRRISAALPTLRTLRDRGARVLVATHLGRPGGAPDEALRVAPLAARLAELIDIAVPVAADVAGEAAAELASGLRDGGLCMLENVRFEPGEERNDPELARRFARLCELYVNDAFGAAHRAHASTEGVAHHRPAAAGRLMARELDVLGDVLTSPRRPLVAVLGGAKISTKIGVVRNLLPRVDALWIGGAMACTFYRALGVATGTSLVEEDQVAVARELLDGTGEDIEQGRLRLPLDVIVAGRADGGPTRVVSWREIPDGEMVVDVGPATVARMIADAAGAGTVIWNGPLGIYEVAEFGRGTRAVALGVADSHAVTVVGGGDLAAAVREAGVEDRIDHVSTGGGATLELLEGIALPGVSALWTRDQVVEAERARA